MSFFRLRIVFGVLALASAPVVLAQGVDVLARIELQAGSQKLRPAAANVVVWLTPDSLISPTSAEVATPRHFRMEQKNKHFNPHLLVVPLGSTVEFPNLDPFFHNVFSQFNGKRFDLGLYEAGSTRGVHFDHEGVSYIFCNIHSQMAAVIVTLRTPYFAETTHTGAIEMHHVPPGDYELHVWAEGADAKQLDVLTRRVHIGTGQRDLGTMAIVVPGLSAPHKNKFGEDYKPDRQSY